MIKIIFECIECGKQKEKESVMFSGRVMTTCIECLKIVKNPEGPVYEIDLGESCIPEDSKWFTQPEATVTSLFLVRCKWLSANLETGIIEGFTYEEETIAGNVFTASAKIKNGPQWNELEEWYADKDASPLITRHIPDIDNSELYQGLNRIRPIMNTPFLEINQNVKSIYSENPLIDNSKQIIIKYCKGCDKVLEIGHECIDVTHQILSMSIAQFLNWKVLHNWIE